MSHCIHGIVAKAAVANLICAEWPSLCPAALKQSFAFIPIEAEFIEAATGTHPPQSTETFILLSDELHGFLANLSRLGRFAYIETEYFGGAGGQGSALYEDGDVMTAPKWSAHSVINLSLAELGVVCQDGCDEFDSLMLGTHRDNDGWHGEGAQRP